MLILYSDWNLESTAVFNSGFWMADLLKRRALTPCSVLVALDLQDHLVKCPKEGSYAWCLFLDSCQLNSWCLYISQSLAVPSIFAFPSCSLPSLQNMKIKVFSPFPQLCLDVTQKYCAQIHLPSLAVQVENCWELHGQVHVGQNAEKAVWAEACRAAGKPWCAFPLPSVGGFARSCIWGHALPLSNRCST